ncbi:MaoC family dehydratase [Gemmatimonas sp.]|uniref:MaoC family dehydratase n=1 Tax=Gemmatimonas sp. TaxID=1962908 RepID=UPI003568EA78
MSRSYDAREERFGGFLENYQPRDTFRHWPGKTITEADDHMFCLLTLASSPLHIDAHFAQEEMDSGRNVVVGTYIYSLLLGMSVPDISGRAIANLGVEKLQHVAPLYHGDTLYGSSEVLSTRVSLSRPDRGILRVTTTGTNQDGIVVCWFTRSVMLPRLPDRVTPG